MLYENQSTLHHFNRIKNQKSHICPQKKPWTKSSFCGGWGGKHSTIGRRELSQTKGICKRPTASITLHGRKTESFSSKTRNNTRMSTSTILIQHYTGGCLIRTIRQEKKIKIKKHSDWKKEVKLYWRGHDFVYRKSWGISIRTYKQYKINIKHQLYFYTLATNTLKMKLNKQFYVH